MERRNGHCRSGCLARSTAEGAALAAYGRSYVVPFRPTTRVGTVIVAGRSRPFRQVEGEARCGPVTFLQVVRGMPHGAAATASSRVGDDGIESPRGLSTFKPRCGGSVLGRPAWISTRVTVPWCACQLACNGAPAPFLDVMKTQYLRLHFRRDGHGALLVSDLRLYRRRNAMRSGQQHPHRWQRRNPRP
jgi:hypothetical protein